MANDAQLPADAKSDHALLRAWIEIVPAEQSAILSTLAPEKRASTLRRLSAILRYEAGEGTIDDLAVEAMVSRRSFIDIKRKWAECRSLEVLVPHAKPNPRSAKNRPREVEIVRAVFSASSTAHQLASTIREESSASLPTLRHLVRRERRAQATQAESLKKNFGRAFAIDIAGVEYPVSEVGCPPEWALAVFFVERASGLLLAARLVRRFEAGDAMWRVLREGVRKWEELKLQPATDEVPIIDVVLSDEMGTVARLRLVKELTSALPAEHIHHQNRYRFGQYVVEAAGPKIGRAKIRPRAASQAGKAVTSRMLETKQILALDEAAALFSREVAHHNDTIIGTLRPLGLVGTGDAPSPLQQLLEPLLARAL